MIIIGILCLVMGARQMTLTKENERANDIPGPGEDIFRWFFGISRGE